MKALSKSNVHSRFVPREEINGALAWEFSSIDDEEEASKEAASLPDPEQPNADPMESDAVQNALEIAYQEGYAAGHEAGTQETLAATEAETQKAKDEAAQRMGQLLHTMTEQLLDSEQAIARQMLELACEIARQVVRQELHGKTQPLRTVIAEALEMMVDDGLPSTIHLNPEDHAAMKDALLETLGENAPELVADPTITSGGCLVKSPSTMVDATIEKRWSRAVGNLGLSIKWEKEASHD